MGCVCLNNRFLIIKVLKDFLIERRYLFLDFSRSVSWSFLTIINCLVLCKHFIKNELFKRIIRLEVFSSLLILVLSLLLVFWFKSFKALVKLSILVRIIFFTVYIILRIVSISMAVFFNFNFLIFLLFIILPPQNLQLFIMIWCLTILLSKATLRIIV